jgi:hypothetical protein
MAKSKKQAIVKVKKGKGTKATAKAKAKKTAVAQAVAVNVKIGAKPKEEKQQQPIITVAPQITIPTSAGATQPQYLYRLEHPLNPNPAIQSHQVPRSAPGGSVQQNYVIENTNARAQSAVETTAPRNNLQTPQTNYESLFHNDRPQQTPYETPVKSLIDYNEVDYKQEQPTPIAPPIDYDALGKDQLRTEFNTIFSMGHGARQAGFTVNYLRSTIRQWNEYKVKNPFASPSDWIQTRLPQSAKKE